MFRNELVRKKKRALIFFPESTDRRSIVVAAAVVAVAVVVVAVAAVAVVAVVAVAVHLLRTKGSDDARLRNDISEDGSASNILQSESRWEFNRLFLYFHLS